MKDIMKRKTTAKKDAFGSPRAKWRPLSPGLCHGMKGHMMLVAPRAVLVLWVHLLLELGSEPQLVRGLGRDEGEDELQGEVLTGVSSWAPQGQGVVATGTSNAHQGALATHGRPARAHRRC